MTVIIWLKKRLYYLGAPKRCLGLQPTLFVGRQPGDEHEWDVCGAGSFNNSLSSWDVSRVTDMGSMFHGALCNEDLGYMICSSSFNGDSWDVSRVTNMGGIFWHAKAFNSDLSVVSQVTNMATMFRGAHSFNSDVSSYVTA